MRDGPSRPFAEMEALLLRHGKSHTDPIPKSDLHEPSELIQWEPALEPEKPLPSVLETQFPKRNVEVL